MMVNFLKNSSYIITNQCSLVNLISLKRFYHSSIILNSDQSNSSNKNIGREQVEVAQLSLSEGGIEELAKIEPINVDLQYGVEELRQEMRKILEEEFLEEIQNISSFSEAFPELTDTEKVSTLSQLQKVMKEELPKPFQQSPVFTELKNRFIHDCLILNQSQYSENVTFLKNAFKILMDEKVNLSSVNDLNTIDSSGGVKDPLVEIKDGKLTVNLKRSADLSPLIYNFILNHKDQIIYSGAGAIFSILFYYRSIVKLHAKALTLDDKHVMSLNPTDRFNLLNNRQKQITLMSLVGATLVATSLYGISQAVNNVINRGKKSSSISLLPFFKNKSKNSIKINWRIIILTCVCFIVVTILKFLGINSITDIISMYKFGVIINLMFGYIIAYNTVTLLLIIYSPQEFKNSKLFKILPRFIKNYYLEFYKIENPVMINYYLKLFILGIAISIFTLFFFNIFLLFY